MKKLKYCFSLLIIFILGLIFNTNVYAAETNVSEVNIYHQHSGTAGKTSANGCYTKAKATTQSITCTDRVTIENTKHEGQTCPNCGPQYFMIHSYHWKCPYEGWGKWVGKLEQCQKCGWTDSTGETSTNTTKTHTITQNITVYELGCGKTPSTVVGKLALYKDNSSDYILKITPTTASVTSYSWNTGATTSSIKVQANGTYSCTVKYNIENRTETKTLSYTVTDYDVIPPTFDFSVDYNDMIDDTVAVSISNVYDEGGIHTTPYSFDGGNTWVSDAKMYIYGQGTFEICVRDKCLNITRKTIVLNCLLNANVNIVSQNDVTISNNYEYASFKITINNYTSYSFVRQKKESAVPQNNNWEVIDVDNNTYSEDILVTSTTDNGFTSRTTTLTVKDANADDYWYGVLVRKQTSEGNDIQSPIYAYNDVHINFIDAVCSFSNLEAGETLTLDNFIITATFNDNDKVIINDIDKYKNNLLFEEGSISVNPRTVGTYNSKILLNYNNTYYEYAFSLQITDSIKPVINNISNDNYEIYSSVQEQEMTINIEAEDNSDNPLMYGFTFVDSISSPTYQYSNRITHVFAENSYVNVFVKDYAGNVEKRLFYVCFIDLEAPKIEGVDITPNIYTSASKYNVKVNASDDCATEGELLYKFVLDGNIIQDFSHIPSCDITQNGKLEIYVKDKTGKVTKYSSEIAFNYADNKKPVINDIKLRVASNQIIASVEATDETTKELLYGYTSYAGNVSQKENVFTITQTGDYTFFVIDEAGNKQEKTIHIDIGELTKNSLLYTIVSTASLKPLGNVYEINGIIYTDTGYELQIYYKKGIDTSHILTSLDKKEYKNIFTYKFDKNGNYTLYSRNTSEESEYTGPVVYTSNIKISGIDKEKPTLTVNKSNKTITINTKDNMSGIKKIVIETNEDEQKKENEIYCGNHSLAFSHSFEVDENKVYKIYCIDNVGNKSSIQAVSPNGILNTDKDLKIYKVVFLSEKGGILKEQQVLEGYPAIAPVAPEKKGFAFTKWSDDYSSVTKNLYIYPLYENLGLTEVIKPVYDESLRYKLVTNPFAFSSRFSGKSETPIHKLAQINPYEEGIIEYKKDTYNNKNDIISSGKQNVKEENILQMTITNPLVMIPLLLLVSVIILVHLIKRKVTKEY